MADDYRDYLVQGWPVGGYRDYLIQFYTQELSDPTRPNWAAAVADFQAQVVTATTPEKVEALYRAIFEKYWGPPSGGWPAPVGLGSLWLLLLIGLGIFLVAGRGR
mgnify:FL=1